MIYPFISNSTKWSAANARACARLAALAYLNEPAQVSANLKTDHGLTRCQIVEASATDTQGFVASNDQIVVVAFRGTEPVIKDWMTDARAARLPFPPGSVHRGFLRAFTSIWDQIQAEIRRHQTGKQTLWFTGHSLGGALATLAVAKLRLSQPPQAVQGLYTFGCARVGDLDFRVAFDTDFSARAFRYVNEDDIVPQLAPEDLGYHHVGRLLWFDATGKLSRDVSGYETLLKGSQVDFASVLAGVVAPLENHSMKYYYAKASTESGQRWT